MNMEFTIILVITLFVFTFVIYKTQIANSNRQFILNNKSLILRFLKRLNKALMFAIISTNNSMRDQLIMLLTISNLQ